MMNHGQNWRYQGSVSSRCIVLSGAIFSGRGSEEAAVLHSHVTRIIHRLGNKVYVHYPASVRTLNPNPYRKRQDTTTIDHDFIRNAVKVDALNAFDAELEHAAVVALIYDLSWCKCSRSSRRAVLCRASSGHE